MLLSLLVTAAIAAGYVFAHARSAWKSLPQILSSAVTEYVDGKFTVGKVDVSAGGIVFRGVVLTSDKKGSQPIIDAEAVKIGFRLADLIRNRKDPARAIDSVEIVRPDVVLVRGRDGRWNIADLLKPSPDRPATQFKGRVVIKSGTVTIIDREQAGKAEKNGLTKLNAIIDFADSPVADCRLTAEGAGGRVGKIAIKARYNLGSRSLNADLDGLRADISYWTKYPIRLNFMNVPSGRADVRAHLSMAGAGKPLRYTGEFLIDNAAVRLNKMRRPAKQVSGLVKLTDKEFTLALRARLDSSPVRISGRVIGLKGSRLALDVLSERANLRELANLASVAVPKGMVLPTTGRAHASISGPAVRPTVVFRVDAPTLAYNGLSGTNLRVEGTYALQRAAIRSVTGRMYGGTVEASGEFGWGRNAGISLHGSASGVRLSQVPSLKGKGVDAVTSGHFGIEWGASNGLGTYRGTLSDGAVQGHKFSKGVIALSYDGGAIHIDEVGAEMLGGKIAASGDVLPNGDLDLEVSGAGINLTAVQELYWSHPTVGKLQFTGRLQGTPNSPSFDGQVEAYRVMVDGIGAERIAADIAATRRQVQVRELRIDDPAGTVTAYGEITNPLAAIPQIDLSISAESVDIKRFAVASELPFELDGALSGAFKITRTPVNPDIEGVLRIEKGVVADMPLDSADAEIKYHNFRLTLVGFTARSGNGVVTAEGSIGLKDRAVKMTFDAENLPLAKLADSAKEYVRLSGDVNARGELSGTVEDTIVRASIDSANPRINGQDFGALEAEVSWADDKLQMSKASLTDGETTYSMSDVSYAPMDGRIDITARAEHALLEKLADLIEKGPHNGATARLRGYLTSLPKPCTGVLGLDVSGWIGLTESGVVPALHVEGTVTNARVGLSDINTVRLEGDWQGDTIRLSKLEAIDGDTDVVADAVLGPSEEIAVHIDAHGLDLGSAARWFKLDQNLSGTADVTIIAEGTTSAPSVEASLDIENPAIGSMKFDGLRARFSGVPLGEGGSSENRINIDDLTIVLGDSQLRAAGYIPIDWSSYSIPRDRELLVEMFLDDGSLSLLSAFAGQVIQGEAGGSLSGKIGYSGTIDKPVLQGGLKWRGGSVRLASLNKPFEQIDADVTLSGHTLSIDSLVGKSAEGGSFRISGPVDLTGLKPKLDLSLATSSLKVSGKNISGRYGENIEVVLDSDLRVTGDWLKPQFAGRISVPRGTLGMGPGYDQPKTASQTFDPRFDLDVTVGRGLVFKSAQLQTALPGTLSVGGPLSALVVDGLLNLADGTITFPMRSLKILPGSDMRLRVAPGQPVLAVLDLKARGHVVDYTPLGKRAKYTITMEASGPLDKLRPTFTSSPMGLTEQRIVALVTGQYHFEQILSGNSGSDVGKELSGLFSSAVLPTVFAPIEEALEEAFGVDDFALEMGYREPVQLSIGDQLGRNTYISYSAVLGARPDYADSRYEVTLSYRVRDNLEVGLQTDEDGTLGISAEGKIRF